MFYGHLDKQPYEDQEWSSPPTEPVIRNGRLYGRGSYDDGYAAYSTMLALKAAQMRGAYIPKVRLMLETEEESDSANLPMLLDLSKEYTGKPDCLVCLDSGCLDYDRLWVTSSMRGVVELDLTIQCGETNQHDGLAGGIVPETFRVLRTLLDRLDDKKTGKVVDSL